MISEAGTQPSQKWQALEIKRYKHGCPRQIRVAPRHIKSPIHRTYTYLLISDKYIHDFFCHMHHGISTAYQSTMHSNSSVDLWHLLSIDVVADETGDECWWKIVADTSGCPLVLWSLEQRRCSRTIDGFYTSMGAAEVHDLKTGFSYVRLTFGQRAVLWMCINGSERIHQLGNENLGLMGTLRSGQRDWVENAGVDIRKLIKEC